MVTTTLEPAAEPYLSRRCPSCNAPPSEARPSVAAAVPAERSRFSDVAQKWYGFFKEKSFFSYHRCSACGFLYAPVYFTDRQLEYLYHSMPPNMAEVSDIALERTQLGYFRELQKAAPLRGNFLEIGPDIGMFAAYARTYGNFRSYWMFEPNVGTHDELRRRLAGTDLHISTQLLDLREIPSHSIDVACMIHVLDHILDPVTFLSNMRERLAPGATVLIVTHDERSALARLLGRRWPAYCLQHPHLFNPGSMRTLLQNAGFQTLKTVRSTNHFPLSFLVKQLSLALGIRGFDLPVRFRAQLPLRLGNFITFAR